jgi:hypothetical protein
MVINIDIFITHNGMDRLNFNLKELTLYTGEEARWALAPRDRENATKNTSG